MTKSNETAANDTNSDGLAKLGELIKKMKFAMLVTVAGDDGSLRARPMATQEMQPDGTLWFFTGASDGKADEIAHDQHVCVAYASPDDMAYVSVSGRARVVRDKEKAKQFWNPAYKLWFPGGLDDPNLALIQVTVEKAEYWDSPSSAVVHLVGLATALVTGKKYVPGEHGKVDVGG